MRKFPFRIALLTLMLLALQVTWALAGTTGVLNGRVVLQDGTGVAGAKVTVTAASGSVTTSTDSTGSFSFVSLIPDTYTVTASKNDIEPVSQPGITVIADQTQSVTLRTTRVAKVIGQVTTRAATELVKPGTTADVYSVNATTQERVATLGGGGSLDQAYSALAANPGVYVAPGQSGWFQNVLIRGGDFDQVGYEFDGVPVNRSFDNYPSSSASTLGQQELQLYTGASPANAEAAGIAGFINQVIKTGTYPGFGNLSLGIGSPQLYNKASLEVGGATPNRNFSYYLAFAAADTGPRYYDNSNGAGEPSRDFGVPYDAQTDGAGCAGPQFANFVMCYANTGDQVEGIPVGPGGYTLGGLNIFNTAHLQDRENVMNVHIGLPHSRDSGKDDIQLLYSTYDLITSFYNSQNDWGGPNFFNVVDANGADLGPGLPFFIDGYQYNGPVGVPLPANAQSLIVPYLYPSTPHTQFQTIPANIRGTFDNGQGIFKVQYQHNIGSSAYFRIYGYSYYSWWFIHDPPGTYGALAFLTLSPDYELTTHTRGLSASYANQLTPKHLLNAEAAFTTATTVRDNNTQMYDLFGQRSRFAVLVKQGQELSGICYNKKDLTVLHSCERDLPGADRASFLSLGGVFQNGVPAAPPGFEWFAEENGVYATYNTVKPKFSAFSIQDQWKPTDKLLLNLGLRYDSFQFDLAQTAGPQFGARTFWFNAWNAVKCFNPAVNGGTPFDETAPADTGAPATLPAEPAGTPCSVYGPGYANAIQTNSTAGGGSVRYPEWQPRIGGTYTLDPDDVIRFSYGKFTQPPNAAYEQYNHLQQNLPNFLGELWFKIGFNTPEHDVRPSISYNSDLSFEHHFRGTDTSFKLTPYYRKTNDQQQNFFIDPTSGFISGVNAGSQTSYGVEFQLQKGDFNRDGLSALLSYTYTHSRIRYHPAPNGTSLLNPINTDIQKYNSFTSACVGAAPSTNPLSLCGVNGGANALPTEANGVANPYFNQPAQTLLDPNAEYAPYDIIPAGVQLSGTGYVVPNVATLVLNYKRGKWAFTPALQYHDGSPYGMPESTVGADPSTCSALTGATLAGDPRYPKSGTGTPYDATTCTGSLVIPDTYTGKFDQPGAFTNPSQVAVHMQISYEASSRVSFRVNLLNLYNRCYGGTKAPWVVDNGHWCSYGTIGNGAAIPPVGNFYNPANSPTNPTTAIQRFVQYPYAPGEGVIPGSTTAFGFTQPFDATFQMDVKL